MDQEVARTLGDLELKLAELERELTSIGRREASAETASPSVEPAEASAEVTSVPVGKTNASDTTTSTGGRLVDEAIEPEYRPVFDAHPPVGGPPPQHRPPAEQRQAIDITDLVRFRDKLAQTMDELIDEYSRLLSLQPPGPPHPPDA